MMTPSKKILLRLFGVERPPNTASKVTPIFEQRLQRKLKNNLQLNEIERQFLMALLQGVAFNVQSIKRGPRRPSWQDHATYDTVEFLKNQGYKLQRDSAFKVAGTTFGHGSPSTVEKAYQREKKRRHTQTN